MTSFEVDIYYFEVHLYSTAKYNTLRLVISALICTLFNKLCLMNGEKYQYGAYKYLAYGTC